jgi:hypothetical protein
VSDGVFRHSLQTRLPHDLIPDGRLIDLRPY